MSTSPIFSRFSERPPSQGQRSSKMIFQTTLRDTFTWPTWVLIGAFLQGLIALLPYRNIALVAPVALIMLYQVGRTMLTLAGMIPNHRMDGVIPGRTTVVFPNDKTGQQERPGDETVCAIVLAIRSNHPLGFFAPGFETIGKFFEDMFAELDNNATELGYLGCSRWNAAGDRGYAGENMSLLYFKSAEKVHEYAHGPLHTKATLWWMKTVKDLPYIGIMHEIIEAPKGHWEGVYLNYHTTGLGATAKEVEADGQKTWVNPLVKAKGPLMTSKYRMTGMRPSEKDWPEFEESMQSHSEDAYLKA